MSQKLRILAGFRSDFGRQVVETLRSDGHDVQCVYSTQKIFENMGLFNQDDMREPVYHHDYIIMDAHLGSDDTKIFVPSARVFHRIFNDVMEGRISFMAFAKEKESLLGAREKEIPIIGLREMNKLLQFYSMLKGEEDVFW